MFPYDAILKFHLFTLMLPEINYSEKGGKRNCCNSFFSVKWAKHFNLKLEKSGEEPRRQVSAGNFLP